MMAPSSTLRCISKDFPGDSNIVISGGHSLREDMSIMSITHTLSAKMIIGIGRLMWLAVHEDDR